MSDESTLEVGATPTEVTPEVVTPEVGTEEETE